MNLRICSQWISVGIERSIFGKPLEDGWGKVYRIRYLPALNVEAAEALAATTPLSLMVIAQYPFGARSLMVAIQNSESIYILMVTMHNAEIYLYLDAAVPWQQR